MQVNGFKGILLTKYFFTLKTVIQSLTFIFDELIPNHFLPKSRSTQNGTVQEALVLAVCRTGSMLYHSWLYG